MGNVDGLRMIDTGNTPEIPVKIQTQTAEEAQAGKITVIIGEGDKQITKHYKVSLGGKMLDADTIREIQEIMTQMIRSTITARLGGKNLTEASIKKLTKEQLQEALKGVTTIKASMDATAEKADIVFNKSVRHFYTFWKKTEEEEKVESSFEEADEKKLKFITQFYSRVQDLEKASDATTFTNNLSALGNEFNQEQHICSESSYNRLDSKIKALNITDSNLKNIIEKVMNKLGSTFDPAKTYSWAPVSSIPSTSSSTPAAGSTPQPVLQPQPDPSAAVMLRPSSLATSATTAMSTASALAAPSAGVNSLTSVTGPATKPPVDTVVSPAAAIPLTSVSASTSPASAVTLHPPSLTATLAASPLLSAVGAMPTMSTAAATSMPGAAINPVMTDASAKSSVVAVTSPSVSMSPIAGAALQPSSVVTSSSTADVSATMSAAAAISIAGATMRAADSAVNLAAAMPIATATPEGATVETEYAIKEGEWVKITTTRIPVKRSKNAEGDENELFEEVRVEEPVKDDELASLASTAATTAAAAAEEEAAAVQPHTASTVVTDAKPLKGPLTIGDINVDPEILEEAFLEKQGDEDEVVEENFELDDVTSEKSGEAMVVTETGEIPEAPPIPSAAAVTLSDASTLPSAPASSVSSSPTPPHVLRKTDTPKRDGAPSLNEEIAAGAAKINRAQTASPDFQGTRSKASAKGAPLTTAFKAAQDKLHAGITPQTQADELLKKFKELEDDDSNEFAQKDFEDALNDLSSEDMPNVKTALSSRKDSQSKRLLDKLNEKTPETSIAQPKPQRRSSIVSGPLSQSPVPRSETSSPPIHNPETPPETVQQGGQAEIPLSKTPLMTAAHELIKQRKAALTGKGKPSPEKSLSPSQQLGVGKSKLQEAQEAFNAKNYQLALSLTNEASATADRLMATKRSGPPVRGSAQPRPSSVPSSALNQEEQASARDISSNAKKLAGQIEAAQKAAEAEAAAKAARANTPEARASAQLEALENEVAGLEKAARGVAAKVQLRPVREAINEAKEMKANLDQFQAGIREIQKRLNVAKGLQRGT